jgi:hypothetical protein
VVLAVTATGEAKVACCQPPADSPLKVTLASRVPAAFHSDPVWVPVLPEPL